MINDLPQKQSPNYFLIFGLIFAGFSAGFILSQSIMISEIEQLSTQFECTKIEVLP